jgi:hypothetical protein
MVKKLLSLVSAVALSLSFVGLGLAEDFRGRISKVENDGRTVTIRNRDGKEVTVRVSSGDTTLEGISERSELKEGLSVNVTFDENDERKTASKIATIQR